METIIISRTRMQTGLCISGICLKTGRKLRLIPIGRNNQPFDSQLFIGDIWDMEYRQSRNLIGPHQEDVIILSQRKIGAHPDWEGFNRNLQPDWSGNLKSVFDGRMVISPSGKCLIPADGPIPSQSTGYWENNSFLLQMRKKKRIVLFNLDQEAPIYLPFVGETLTGNMIRPGCLVRLSLSRKFDPGGDTGPGYFLQVSDWIDRFSTVSMSA